MVCYGVLWYGYLGVSTADSSTNKTPQLDSVAYSHLETWTNMTTFTRDNVGTYTLIHFIVMQKYVL